MASEVFNNFLSKKAMTPGSKITIVPVAGGSLTDGIGSRTDNTVCQLHSIYITQQVDTNQSSNPLANGVPAYITLIVKDNSSGTEYPIAYNVLVLPHSAFYIEKTITLKNNQLLILQATSLNTTTKTLFCVCSGVDMVQA